jgi:hypothetical protein
MNSDIIVVSGLPRSGTSLMMQMLEAGGIPIVTDNERVADADNPRGYREFERVKKLKHDASWLPQIRGKAVKMVSQLLYDLPATEHYRVLFMDRDLNEVLVSQEKMLARLGQSAAPCQEMARAFTLHLARLRSWLADQSHMAVLAVRYAELVANPAAEAARMSGFLEGRLEVAAAVQAVDPSLYRNRKNATT